MFNHSMRHAHGWISVSDPSGGNQEFDTVKCCHCGSHSEYVPGSGRRRSFCFKCNRLTCGNPTCDACVPLEARLEHAEGHKTNYDDTIKQLRAEGAILL